MYYSWKTLLFALYIFLLCILAFFMYFLNKTINNYKFKCSVEVYPIEAYLIGNGVIEISGCHRTRDSSNVGLFLVMPSLLPLSNHSLEGDGEFSWSGSKSLRMQWHGQGTWDSPCKRLGHMFLNVTCLIFFLPWHPTTSHTYILIQHLKSVVLVT